MATLDRKEREKIMETASQHLTPLVSAQQVLDWYAELFPKLGAKAIGQIIMGEHKRRLDAKKAKQRRAQKKIDKFLEAEAKPPGYSDQDFANRGQPQKGARGPLSRQFKAHEQALKEIKREDAEGIEFSEDEGERAKG